MVWYGMVRPSKANGIRALAFPFPFPPTPPTFYPFLFVSSPFSFSSLFFLLRFSLSSLFSFFSFFFFLLFSLSSSHSPRPRRPRRIVLVLLDLD